MYGDKWNYLNGMQDRYDRVYDFFLRELGIDLRMQAIVVDLCAGDGGIAKYCDRYYGCDIEPRDEEDEWGHRRVQTATDRAFVKYVKPKLAGEYLGERVLCSFGYGGRAGVNSLHNKSIKESELEAESGTLDDSIFDLLEYSDFFVLEGCATYVDGFIDKFRFDVDEAIYKWERKDEQWNLDRKLYIFRMD